MRRPPDSLSTPLTRLLLAVVRVYNREGRCTVRDAMREAGYGSVGSGQEYLRQLRDLGLVSWEDGRTGTLRPTVAIVIARAA